MGHRVPMLGANKSASVNLEVVNTPISKGLSVKLKVAVRGRKSLARRGTDRSVYSELEVYCVDFCSQRLNTTRKPCFVRNQPVC